MIDPEIKPDLFPFQLAGVDWLKTRRFGLLADEMGLGKTVQAIRAFEELGLNRVLVICPAVARMNWKIEFERWSKKSPKFFVPTQIRERLTPYSLDSVICSFEYASRSDGLKDHAFDLIVIDEVHFLKSIEARRARLILGKDGLVHKTKRTWVLSGTPAPNHAGELWTLLYVFGVTRLQYTAFIETYCETVYGPRGLQILGTKRAKIPELKTLLQNFMKRRLKKDVLKDLPPIFMSEIAVEPGTVVMSETLTAELKSKIAKETALVQEILLKSENPMAVLEGLADSVSTLRRYIGLQKVGPAVEMVKGELEMGLYSKIVIFAVHREVVLQLIQGLKAFNPVAIYGGISPEVRQENVRRFQTDPKVQVFVGNILAAGTNLTLTAAHQVLVVEPDWVPGNNAQAVMRCHRIGQENTVYARFMVLGDNSLDGKVTRVLRKKTKELTEIFDC